VETIRSAGNGLATLIHISVDGGTGNDTITGSDGTDTITGGDGNDLITGGRGNDNLLGGAGGTQVQFTRDIGGVVMDVNGTEAITFNALGGADRITVHDLTGTDVTEVNVNLGVPGGGDGSIDSVIVEGSADADVATVNGDASGTTVGGLPAAVSITGAESTDKLAVNTQAGDDVVDATGLSATALQFSADGGDGDDELMGGAGDDTLTGGNGDDILIGGPRQVALDGGPGDNIVIQ